MSHTPGPWYWRQTSEPDSRDDGRYYYRWRLGGRSCMRVGMMDQISHEDAHLIKAAVDYHAIAEDGLPEFLETLASEFRHWPASVTLREFAGRLKKARAKARGETPGDGVPTFDPAEVVDPMLIPPWEGPMRFNGEER